MSSTQIPSSSPLRDVLLGCTGSIAAVKLPALALALHDAGLTVTVVLTKAGACLEGKGAVEGGTRTFIAPRRTKTLSSQDA